MPALVAGCAVPSTWAPDEAVERVRYHDDGPPSLTLYTVKTTRSGQGAHSGLMINASERVIFDPAGSFAHPTFPERNDVIFGITPRIEQYYISYHTRVTYYTTRQQIIVSAAAAQRAYELALANGPVAKSHCTESLSHLLRQVPGFEMIQVTWFPNNLERQFAALPGVSYQEFFEQDDDDKSQAAQEMDQELKAGQ